MAVRLSALRAGRPLPQEDSWCSERVSIANNKQCFKFVVTAFTENTVPILENMTNAVSFGNIGTTNWRNLIEIARANNIL
jgi:protein-arginine kinase